MPVDVVLFDLGGVLTEFRGAAALRELTGAASEEEVWSRWLTSPWVRRFEAGTCSPEAFARGIVSEWELRLTPAELMAAFTGWLRDPFEGAEELVRAAGGHAAVGCLSNTNSLHWEAVIGRWPMLEAFVYRFLSFELGMVKPDAEIFEHVAATLPVARERILFLDDNLPNVEAARAAGLRSEQVRGVEEARRALLALGVVD